MLNIVVPLAGAGVCFFDEDGTWSQITAGGQGTAKIEMLVRSVRPSAEHRFIFPVLLEDLGQVDVAKRLQLLAPGCVIIPVAKGTRGEACTVMLARKMIDSDEPLLIAVGEAMAHAGIDRCLAEVERRQVDGAVMTAISQGADQRRRITDLVDESRASGGLYYFRRGTDFVRAAAEMIRQNLHVNNEFHIAPACRQMQDWGQTMLSLRIGQGNGNYAAYAGRLNDEAGRRTGVA